MNTNSDRRKELKEQYNNRHPDKGLVCWKSKGRIWVMPTQDANADYNGTKFQLDLGSWPNRDLQNAYKQDPESFEWSFEKELKYEDNSDDVSDDLSIMLMEFMDEYPDAKLMRPIKIKR